MGKNYAIMRQQKIRTLQDLKLALQHNRRERVPENAKPDIPLENRLNEMITKQTEDFPVLKEKCRKNAIKAVEWLFTGSDMDLAWKNTNYDQTYLNKWVETNINFVAEKMGGRENILSAVVHWDETEPHMHIIAIPEYEHKLNCKHFLGGKKYLMRDFQNEYAELMKPFGLDRGELKQRKYNDHLKSDLKKLEAEIEVKKNEIVNLDKEYELLKLREQQLTNIDDQLKKQIFDYRKNNNYFKDDKPDETYQKIISNCKTANEKKTAVDTYLKNFDSFNLTR